MQKISIARLSVLGISSVLTNSFAQTGIDRVAGLYVSGPAGVLIASAGNDLNAMADQLMAADNARLKSQLGTVSKADMRALEDAIRVHLGLAK